MIEKQPSFDFEEINYLTSNAEAQNIQTYVEMIKKSGKVLTEHEIEEFSP